MKRRIAILLVIAMLACGCGKENDENVMEASSVVTTSDVTSEVITNNETTTAETAVTTISETTADTTAATEETTVTEVTSAPDSETEITTTATTTAAEITTVETTVTTEKTTVTTTETETTATTQKSSAPSKNDFSMSSMEIVEDMGIGINLGNTYEACGDWIAQWGDGSVESYETAWGSPVITEKMIKGYADEGFGVLRVPVAWSNLMGEDYTISKEYMAAVREVVDWALKYDLYVIVNLHWDNGWMEKFPTETDECMKKYTRIWEQICEEFSNYDEKLIFESQNEELGWSSVWNPYGGNTGKEESFALANKINQKFVDIVRSSGGNNDKRHLLISGYNTNIDHCCDKLFKMPDDPIDRCILSVHYYSPATFALLTEDADWGKAVRTWGTAEEKAFLKSEMKKLKDNFIGKDIPVIIGEYGCPTENKEAASVRSFLYSVCKEALDVGACPVLWSTPDGHYDRNTYKMYDQELIAQMRELVE